ncbi:hypothetical protein SD70_17140 [Gordoniibacillus kamchatkensis]|uniref:D-alanyl-D-alanine carboxypeptidase-like core domain-containing protein n=1 Tax=Gordoniibacillus kamchatkensis TaxID=1590651 RepID=A0ABR5AFY8_9BACL|nr:M15 family metallopeptidase [Paenibacillus sp. VKM B-2647]KIL39959.1 hypothetical protein SD70_17140 [Paenibacillus sp. VKM B-2647]
MKLNKTSFVALLLASSIALLAGCGTKNGASARPNDTPPAHNHAAAEGDGASASSGAALSDSQPPSEPAQAPKSSPDSTSDKAGADKGKAPDAPIGEDKGKAPDAVKNRAEQVVAKPDSISVLVNKQFALPAKYEPSDLVYPDVPFIFKENIEKRKMRKEAAAALEKLFAGAGKDGISLAGVSAYRSYATQKALFNNYVKTDGEAKAKTYSAEPGHSEHETGLAIDVTGSDGKCAAQNCFGGTKEAEWLAKHAAEYGFIIRYPKGKEAITGYQYEPWHIRYVGTDMAKEIAGKGLTLEQYLNAVPASAK